MQKVTKSGYLATKRYKHQLNAQLFFVPTVTLETIPKTLEVERLLMTSMPTVCRRNFSENDIQENNAPIDDLYGCPSICELYNQTPHQLSAVLGR